MAVNDDGVPQELKDEVNRIRQQEGGGEPQEEDTEEVGEEKVKLSRRQAKKLAVEEERQAREERDSEVLEASKRAAEEAAETRKQQQAAAERMSRLEGLLEATVIQQQQTVREPRTREPEPESPEKVYQKKMRDATSALAAGKIDEYHDNLRAANDVIFADQLRRQREELMRQAPQQPQNFAKPEWVSAVESQFPDVLMHVNGTNTVVNFHNMMYPRQGATPESLHKAYQRAQEELGLKTKEDPKKLEQKRQMLSTGGRPNNSASRTSGGGREEWVNVPKDYKIKAKQYGMKPDEYLRQWAILHPEDVTKG